MTAVLLGDHEPNSPEWHALRRSGIGASEIAAVVGLSPFESAFSLWHRKKGNIGGADPDNSLFLWGHLLEPVVANRFAAKHPEYAVTKCGTYAAEHSRWQLANVDRALFDSDEFFAIGMELPADHPPRSILEIKTTRYGDGWGRAMTDEIPLHVRCQVMQQMDVLEVDYAWVAVLIGGNDYREYRIDYDGDDAKALRDAGAAFWESLHPSDEPPIDASHETYEAVRELHPDIDRNLDVEIPPAMFHEYLQAKENADTTADHLRQVKSQLLRTLGNARRALVAGTPVLRRQPGRGGNVALYEIKEAS